MCCVKYIKKIKISITHIKIQHARALLKSVNRTNCVLSVLRDDKIHTKDGLCIRTHLIKVGMR